MKSFVKIMCLALSFMLLMSTLVACVDNDEKSKETSNITTVDPNAVTDDFGPLIPVK